MLRGILIDLTSNTEESKELATVREWESIGIFRDFRNLTRTRNRVRGGAVD